MSEIVGIVGAGPFGLALGKILGDHGRSVLMWSTTSSVVSSVTQSHKSERLPGVDLPRNLSITSDVGEFADRCRFVVLAVAPPDVRDRARRLGDTLGGNHILVHAVGALTEGSRRVSEVLEEETPVIRLGVVAGPALPGDLASGAVSSMVCGSLFREVREEAQRLLSAPPTLRLYTSEDLVGVELAAALSGAYTVALGLADGLDVGPGTRAVLVTRALAEAARLGEKIGAQSRSFSGLAGLGNLLVRSSGQAREADYELGIGLARGEKPDVSRCAGAGAVPAMVALARRSGERMPVLEAVGAVLNGDLTPAEAGRAVADTVATTE